MSAKVIKSAVFAAIGVCGVTPCFATGFTPPLDPSGDATTYLISAFAIMAAVGLSVKVYKVAKSWLSQVKG